MPDGDSFAGGTYPEPPEIEEKTIKAKIYVSFEIEIEVPKNWNREQILEEIKENYNNCDRIDETIDDIDL